MYLAKNIRYLRRKNGYSQDFIAKKLDYKSYTTIQKWEMGLSEPSLKKLSELAELFKVDMDDMAKADLALTKSTAVDALSFDNILPIQIKKIPLLGEIACGEAIFANENRASYIATGTDIHADFCLRCKGDSMINARIHNGDIVFIREQPMVDNGEIAAVIIDDAATLKRVFYNPEVEQLILNAENPIYPPQVYQKDELNQIRILGKAIAFQSDVK